MIRLIKRANRGRKLLDEIMGKLELQELADRPLNLLSGGQRQRTALGKVMAQQPEIVLLDEPTTYLDLRYQVQFMELVAAWLGEAGLTVVHPDSRVPQLLLQRVKHDSKSSGKRSND